MRMESTTVALISVLALSGLATSVAATVPAYSSGSSGRQVTITRDDWGIAHVKGVSDADAIFGAMYAQAEDSFPRIEQNLLTALGRLAEAEGEDAVWQDLRQRLWIDEAMLKRDYARSPAWLRTLMQAWAVGLNHYLATHPDEHPRVLTHFEPWMALSFTEGSIGGDMEKASLKRLAGFYGNGAGVAPLAMERLRDGEPRGSNGIAIGGRKSASGHPLLLINPHTSLFFRSELAMESGQGLHAYGAATWGQFFIYQGFNEHLGWMHTTSGADNVDEFAEKVEQRGARWFYQTGKQWRPLISRNIA
ncbi:MAG: penicillin acylase family protein, partial [Novosphingobium sp.]